MVYVCIGGFGEYTCAFNASDGSLRWWTPTDGRVASMPFMDRAVPLVKNGIVYSGTYALSEQDGSVRWREHIDTDAEGTLSLHALAEETLYATTTMGIYAISAKDGQIRWHYQPETSLSGPPVVSGQLLYTGTRDSVGYPPKSYFRALDVETGAEIWRYPMGGYSGAVVHHETIYVSSRDCSLSALEKKGGRLRWRHPFATLGQYPATSPITSSTSLPMEPMRSAARMVESCGTRTWGVIRASHLFFTNRSSRVARSIWCASIDMGGVCSTRSIRAPERSAGTLPIPR